MLDMFPQKKEEKRMLKSSKNGLACFSLHKLSFIKMCDKRDLGQFLSLKPKQPLY